jgi:oxygen-independent coproporphyrinogen-3 oxidase
LGGGTPAELTSEGIARLVEILADRRTETAEVTLEANPRTLLRRKLIALRDGLGVNRLSLGAQSFNPRVLKILGRVHRPEDIPKAVALARDVGIESVSLDLIFAVPGQTHADLRDDIDSLLRLNPDHVSCYCLTIEAGTAFQRDVDAGQLKPTSNDWQGRQFAYVRHRLRAAGFVHYEISNFAKPGALCRHNLTYWRNHPSHGIGNGAASHLGGIRRMNHRDVLEYVQHIETGGGAAAVNSEEVLDTERKIRETAYLALRTSEGIVPRRFLRDTGVDPRVFFAAELPALLEQGLVEEKGERLRLTGRGVSLADTVSVAIL